MWKEQQQRKKPSAEEFQCKNLCAIPKFQRAVYARCPLFHRFAVDLIIRNWIRFSMKWTWARARRVRRRERETTGCIFKWNCEFSQTKENSIALQNDSYEWNIFKVQRCRNPFQSNANNVHVFIVGSEKSATTTNGMNEWNERASGRRREIAAKTKTRQRNE